MGRQMIFGFDRPHRIGSICRQPCEQCGETPQNLGDMTGAHGFVEPVPLFIVRAATREEYVQYSREVGATLSPVSEENHAIAHFYEVLTD